MRICFTLLNNQRRYDVMESKEKINLVLSNGETFSYSLKADEQLRMNKKIEEIRNIIKQRKAALDLLFPAELLEKTSIHNEYEKTFTEQNQLLLKDIESLTSAKRNLASEIEKAKASEVLSKNKNWITKNIDLLAAAVTELQKNDKTFRVESLAKKIKELK